jgi:cytochrome P450
MTSSNSFDPYAESVFVQGAKAFADHGRQFPLSHYQGKFDFFISSGYDDIKSNMLQDDSTWLYSRGTGPKRLADELANTGMMTDPPFHNEIRMVILRGFTPPNLKRLAIDVDRLIDDLISTMQAMDPKEGNFFQLFSMPLAARLMCIMLGVPEEDYLKYKEWADSFMYKLFNDPAEGVEAEESFQLAQGFMAAIAERRAILEQHQVEPSLEHVGTLLPNDFISRFLCDKVDGRYLTEWEMISMLSAIVSGGNETTMNLICNLLWRLLEKPDRWEQLKANPDLVPAAIEESLRYDPPVIGMFRTAAKDTELQGHAIPKDARVMYNIAAANRNPEIWENPDEFRLDRPASTQRQHAAFSGGHHMCLGMALARMEVRQVFEKLITELPNLRLTAPPTRAPGFNFNGQIDLPVAWG